MSKSGNGAIEVAVVGVGRMGLNHARIYRQIDGANLVAVVDIDAERAATVADEFGCAAYTNYEQLLMSHPQLRGVTVAVPTAQHRQITMLLLQRDISCLVEKPLAATMQQAKEIADLAKTRSAILQVGHTERFNPAVQAVMAMGVTPRFIEVDRISPMTFRSLDVGVVMDMMSHDLDIVLTLADSPLTKVDATGVAVFGGHEDIANARLVFASGCVANLTASRLALKTERKMRLFSEHCYVSLDYQQRKGMVIRQSENAQMLDHVREQLAAGTDLSNLDYGDLVQIEPLTMDLSADAQDPLTAQLSSFVRAIRTGQPPAVNAAAGYSTVSAAERVLRAIRSHKWQGLVEPHVAMGFKWPSSRPEVVTD